jgi:hypothetical protein
MTDSTPIYHLFDTAVKVNSPWALGAFGIAAVVAIVFVLLSRSDSGVPVKQPALRRTVGDDALESDKEAGPPPALLMAAASAQRSLVPWLAWIVLIVAIVVPVAAYAFVETHSDLPYKFRVLVVDGDGRLIPSPHVVCSAPGCTEEGLIDSAVQFDLPPQYVPADKSVTFFADSNNSHGKKTVTLDKTRSVPVQVDIVPTPTAMVSNPVTTPKTGKPISFAAGEWHGNAPDIKFNFDASNGCKWDAVISAIDVVTVINGAGIVQSGLLKFNFAETPTAGGCSSGIQTSTNAVPLDANHSQIVAREIDLEFQGGNGSRPVVVAQLTGSFIRSPQKSTIDGTLLMQRTDAPNFGHANWKREAKISLMK